MNAGHFHLIVNHLPIFAAMFGGLLMAAGLWRTMIGSPGSENPMMITDDLDARPTSRQDGRIHH
jgi:hypothetical protein